MKRIIPGAAIGGALLLLLALRFSGCGTQRSPIAATNQETADSVPDPRDAAQETETPEIPSDERLPRVVYPDDPLSDLDLLDAEHEKQVSDWYVEDPDPPPPEASVARSTYQFWHQGPVYGVRYSTDGRQLATTTRDGFYIWNAVTGELISKSTWRGFTPLWAHVLSRDMKTMACAGVHGMRVYVADCVTGQLLYTLKEIPGPIRQLTFSADNRFLAASIGKRIFLWNRIDGAHVQ